MTFLWPQRLPTASEVTPGLRTELSDLINPCYHASLTSKWLHELNATHRRTAKCHPLTCVASPQVKSQRERERGLAIYLECCSHCFWPYRNVSGSDGVEVHLGEVS